MFVDFKSTIPKTCYQSIPVSETIQCAKKATKAYCDQHKQNVLMFSCILSIYSSICTHFEDI